MSYKKGSSHSSHLGLEIHERESECYRALSTSSYDEHKDRIEDRAQNTCNWFLGSSQYISWRESRQMKILWVTADPGCGKSVLAKSLIDKELSGSAACFFFFKRGVDEQDKVSTALCAILHQLFRHDPSLLKHAMRDFLQKGPRFCREPRSLWTILIQAARNAGSQEIICVLDAIDECEPSSMDSLLRFFVESCEGSSETLPAMCNIKFLVTGRRDQIIERRLSRLGQSMTFFHASDPGGVPTEIEAEISQYLKWKVQEVGHDLRLEDAVRQSLEDKLMGTVNRTYLWLHLIFREIENSVGVSRMTGLQRIIDTLPTSVSEAYQKILGRVQDTGRATDALRIVLASRRLLTIRELKYALALEDAEAGEPQEDDDYFRLAIQHQCGLLITITNLDEVDLIHSTARTFLESYEHVSAQEQHANLAVWGLPLERSSSHRLLASRCMTYLSTGGWFSALTEDHKSSPMRLQLGEIPFLHYAGLHWAEHVLMGSEEQLLPETLKLLSRRTRIDFLFRLLWPGEGNRSYWTAAGCMLPCHTPAILAASFLGLGEATLALVEEPNALHSTSDRGATALHWAVWKERVSIARHLLKSGIDPSSEDEEGNTALHIAALEGFGNLVDELLTHGASIDAQNNAGHTALHVAVANGQNQVIELLLDRGAALMTPDARGRTVLHNAIDNKIFGQNVETVRLLLSRGIFAQEPDIDNMTPLHLAVQCNAVDIAEELLEHGFSIDIPVKRKTWLTKMVRGVVSYSLHHPSVPLPSQENRCSGYSPLHAAGWFGSAKMVEFLLHHGADPNVQGDLGETPLHLALRKWILNKAILKRTIDDAWADPINFVEDSLDMIVDNWDDEDDSREACRYVHDVRSNTVKILLDCPRYDVSIRDQKGETSLHAVPYGDDDAHKYVLQLIEKGSDVNSRNRQGETAVHLAARAADYQSLDVFSQHQADLLATDDLGRNLLHHACRASGGCTGSRQTVRALIQHVVGPALISAADNRGQNCLHHQVSNWPDVDILRTLLDNGADVRHVDNQGESPLVAAVISVTFTIREDVIFVLLQAGADPQTYFTDGRTLAHLVARNDFLPKLATFELLVDYGVGIDAMDAKGRTILHHAAITGTLTQELLHAMIALWGIDINARDYDRRTALDHAVFKNEMPRPQDMFNSGRWDRTIDLLSKAGAKSSSYVDLSVGSLPGQQSSAVLGAMEPDESKDEQV